MTINVKTAIMIMTTAMIMIIIFKMNMMMIGKESCEARQENHQRRNTQNNLLDPLTQAPRPPFPLCGRQNSRKSISSSYFMITVTMTMMMVMTMYVREAVIYVLAEFVR